MTTSSSTAYSPQCFGTARKPVLRWIEDGSDALVRAWRAWRKARALQANASDLEALGDDARRDLGLAERGWNMPAARSLGWRGGPWV